MSVLTAAPNIGKVAWRDALIKEVCWLTGSNAEARIPTTMRKKPSQFFEMWERLRGKAQKMIAAKKHDTHAQTLLTMEEEAEAAEELAHQTITWRTRGMSNHVQRCVDTDELSAHEDADQPR